jgi:hypothetical protein
LHLEARIPLSTGEDSTSFSISIHEFHGSVFFLDVYFSLTLHDILVPLLPCSCYKNTCGLRGTVAATELALVSRFVEVRNEIQVQDTTGQ